MNLKQIDEAIFWHEHVRKQSRDPKQKQRCDERILKLVQDRMEITRAMAEKQIDKGMREHSAWFDTSAELA
jgi:chorismate mutase